MHNGGSLVAKCYGIGEAGPWPSIGRHGCLARATGVALSFLSLLVAPPAAGAAGTPGLSRHP